LISIIIPTYNRANLLLECLNSILNQTYNDFEILIIDDGSTDDTQLKVCNLNDKIFYHKLNKIGDISKLRNFGIEHSNGDMIAFCDDDDIWNNTKLESQLKYMNDFNITCTNAELINLDGKSIEGVYCTDFENNTKLNTAHLFIRNYIITSTVLVKKDILPEFSFDSLNYKSTAEDYDLWLKLSLDNTILFLNEPQIKYRIHSNLTHRVDNLPYIYINGINIINKYKTQVAHKYRKYAEWGIFRLRKDFIKLNLSTRRYLTACSELLKLSMSVFDFGFLTLLFYKMIFSRKYIILSIDKIKS
jgi:glycosyltransferase involved in cell wall biosynthesis